MGGGAWGAAFGGAIRKTCLPYFWDRNIQTARRAAESAAAEWRESAAAAVAESDIVVVAVSSGGFAETLRLAGGKKPLLWLTKGIAGEDRLLSEAAAEILPSGACFGALGGPTFACEVAKQLPAAMVVAVNTPARLPFLQNALHQKTLRLYPCADLTGVCAAGAIKNVLAIAAGICDGLDLGENARAAVITRGLSEISAFSRALGGRAETMQTVAGIGDVLLTCTSDLSRNRRLGLSLAGRGRAPDGTLEGASSAGGVLRRARSLGLDTPIIAAVRGVLQKELTPRRAAEELLSRPPPVC